MAELMLVKPKHFFVLRTKKIILAWFSRFLFLLILSVFSIAALTCRSAYGQTGCIKQVIIGKVPIESEPFRQQGMLDGNHAIGKIPTFLYYTAIEAGFGGLLTKLGRRCIKISNVSNNNGKPLTPVPANRKYVGEFYDMYYSEEKDYLNSFANTQNISVLVFWMGMDDNDFLSDEIELQMQLYDLHNNTCWPSYIKLHKNRWIRAKEATQSKIIQNIEGGMTKIQNVLTQGLGE